MNRQAHQQLSLFDSPALRLSGLGRAVKLALNQAAGASRLSREEIVIKANEMAAGAGISLCSGSGALSVATLNKWLDPGAAAYMPTLMGLTVLMLILGGGPISPVLDVLGLEAIGPEDQKYRDLGRANAQVKALRRKMKILEEQI